jgi:hypothetical protein
LKTQFGPAAVQTIFYDLHGEKRGRGLHQGNVAAAPFGFVQSTAGTPFKSSS